MIRRLHDPLHSPWLAAALGPAIATVLALPLLPLYQMLVGEITRGKLIELEDLSNPLLKQIAQRAPGTWQHSLMMANLAEIAATVRWDEVMDQLAARGPCCVLEIGGGQALARLWQQRHPAIPARSADEFRTLDGVLDWIVRCAD